jgi:CelD/BcsL family acetyltransferase involved in cellulose biosynthesis
MSWRRFASDDWNAVEAVWAKLAGATPGRTCFVGPAWVGAWLATFGPVLAPEVVLFESGDEPTGAALLVSRTVRRGLLPLRQIHLHTSGEDAGDGVAVEYVSLVCEPKHADEVHAALGALLAGRSWDELVLKGVTEETLSRFTRLFPGFEVETEWRPTYTVDLARLRSEGRTYEETLSHNTRAQLRQSRNRYAERGPLALHFAASTGEALAWLAELGALHQARWSARGEVGAFASTRWRAFHDRLVSAAFPAGGVQLARMCAGDHLIGLLYNLVENGRVAFYQSGFRYEDDNRLKPGLVTHALVVQACLERRHDVYDFLAGGPDGERYKKSLATDTSLLAWCVVRRPTLRNRIASALRGVKHRLRATP